MTNVQRTPFSQVRYAFAKCEPPAKNLAERVHFWIDSLSVCWELMSSKPLFSFSLLLFFIASILLVFICMSICSYSHQLERGGEFLNTLSKIKQFQLIISHTSISYHFLYPMSIAIFLSIYLPKTCDKWENSDEICVQLWSLSLGVGIGQARPGYTHNRPDLGF